MNRAFSLLGVALLGAFALSTASGCEVACAEDEETQGGTCVAKSLTRFNGSDVTKTATWTAGGSIDVNGVYGDITVEDSGTSELQVVFKPFSYRAHDAKDAAVDEMNHNLDLNIQDGGNVTITSARNGGSNGLGAAILVRLPSSFDGTLNIHNHGSGPINPGDVNVKYVGSSPAVTINNDKLGSCTLNGAPTVTTTNVTCDGSTKVFNVADNVTIHTTGLETDNAVELSIASISDTATGGTIDSEDGSIVLTLPSTGNYSVQAQSPTQGTVDLGNRAARLQREDRGRRRKLRDPDLQQRRSELHGHRGRGWSRRQQRFRVVQLAVPTHCPLPLGSFGSRAAFFGALLTGSWVGFSSATLTVALKSSWNEQREAKCGTGRPRVRPAGNSLANSLPSCPPKRGTLPPSRHERHERQVSCLWVGVRRRLQRRTRRYAAPNAR